MGCTAQGPQPPKSGLSTRGSPEGARAQGWPGVSTQHTWGPSTLPQPHQPTVPTHCEPHSQAGSCVPRQSLASEGRWEAQW